jgi:hypothetical protein
MFNDYIITSAYSIGDLEEQVDVLLGKGYTFVGGLVIDHHTATLRFFQAMARFKRLAIQQNLGG